MTIETFASLVIDACESEGIDHMLTGAFASSFYGIPRSTKDVDIVLSLATGNPIDRIAARLSPVVIFNDQMQFDTLTWGKRLVGSAIAKPLFQVELFELFDDPFVLEQFARRRQLYSHQIGRSTWLPTPEDVVIQKLRWGRSKDLDDARDILIVQGPAALDMDHIRRWCTHHGTTARLDAALADIGE